MASSTSSPAKPSVPLPLGKSAMRLAPAESNQHPVVSAPLTDSPKGIKKFHWEEWYYCKMMDTTQQIRENN